MKNRFFRGESLHTSMRFSGYLILAIVASFTNSAAFAQHYEDEGLVIHMADKDFKVDGGMTADDALRGCEGFIPSFKHASTDLHEKQPDFKTKVIVEFVISQSGQVRSAKIKNSTLKDAAPYAEVLAEAVKAKHFEFPALLKGKQALVVCGFTAHSVKPGHLEFPRDEQLLVYPGE